MCSIRLRDMLKGMDKRHKGNYGPILLNDECVNVMDIFIRSACQLCELCGSFIHLI